jgi:hypothetical protein
MGEILLYRQVARKVTSRGVPEHIKYARVKRHSKQEIYKNNNTYGPFKGHNTFTGGMK